MQQPSFEKQAGEVETFWAYQSTGLGMDRLTRTEIKRRPLAEDEVRIRVAAAATNYRDLALAKGEYLPHMKRPFVPLSEGAGIVTEVGGKITDLKVGDAVLGHYTRDWLEGEFHARYHDSKVGGPVDGWLAQEVIMPRRALLEVPEGWTLEQAASLAISGVTAWRALGGSMDSLAQLAGQYVLIEGTGNVSLQALDIAAKAGAFPVVLTSRPQYQQALLGMGACAVIGPGSLEQRRQWIMEATQEQGVSLAIDVIGGDTLLSLILPLMREEGRVAIVGFLDSPKVSGDLIGPMLKGMLRLEGISVGSRQNFADLLEFMQHHNLRPKIAARYSPDEIQQALTQRVDGLGKVVIVVDPSIAGNVVGENA